MTSTNNTTPVEEWEIRYGEIADGLFREVTDDMWREKIAPHLLEIKSFIKNLITLREERARDEVLRQKRQEVQHIRLVVDGRGKSGNEILIEVNRILSPILTDMARSRNSGNNK